MSLRQWINIMSKKEMPSREMKKGSYGHQRRGLFINIIYIELSRGSSAIYIASAPLFIFHCSWRAKWCMEKYRLALPTAHAPKKDPSYRPRSSIPMYFFYQMGAWPHPFSVLDLPTDKEQVVRHQCNYSAQSEWMALRTPCDPGDLIINYSQTLRGLYSD